MRIELQDLYLKYGSFTGLRDMSLTLDGGKIYGLLGRNGSGKTSLLSVLAGFRRPSGGAVAIDGEAPFENARIMRQTCFIRETGNTYEFACSVWDVLKFAQRLRPAWDQEYAEALVRRFNLPLHKKVKALSRGMRSALGVTLGLASRAPLTIFDEAYLGMDAPSRYAFYEELLNDYMANPRTIILSTHLIGEVASLFEEVVIIDHGRLVLHEEKDRLCSRGAAITGPAPAVDRFVEGMTILSQQALGGMKSVMVYGGLTGEQRRRAQTDGLELGPVSLQDLFVHLTANGEAAR